MERTESDLLTKSYLLIKKTGARETKVLAQKKR